MLSKFKKFASTQLDQITLSVAAKAERRLDARGLPATDPGVEAVELAALGWLGAAQDLSPTNDGGAARDFSLLTGWAASYPETSGYIVPTFIDAGIRRNEPELISRALRMTDWLVSIQFPEGGFQGGTIRARPRVPVTFNTGQILMGLAAAKRQFGGQYAEPMHRAAQWLVDTMDADGCWRKFPTPFAAAGEKTYETHVAWGLIEAARATYDPGVAERYAQAALRNARWAITKQHSNGWFDCCCLTLPNAPLTHTIGYALRGLTEIFLHTREQDVLDAAVRTADALSETVAADGFLAGRLDKLWNGAVSWVCVTGSAQIAHSLLLLHGELDRPAYRDAARRLLRYVRRTVHLSGPAGVRGGVKGSFPVDGEYGTYEFLNWAAKFLIDAGQAEITFGST
ncbi:MAG: hypothetical protein ABI035_14140 [Gemmatimonadaceae bacterium]